MEYHTEFFLFSFFVLWVGAVSVGVAQLFFGVYVSPLSKMSNTLNFVPVSTGLEHVQYRDSLVVDDLPLVLSSPTVGEAQMVEQQVHQCLTLLSKGCLARLILPRNAGRRSALEYPVHSWPIGDEGGQRVRRGEGPGEVVVAAAGRGRRRVEAGRRRRRETQGVSTDCRAFCHMRRDGWHGGGGRGSRLR